jgi:N-acetylglucosamine kinase-like BadF-type ATPase
MCETLLAIDVGGSTSRAYVVDTEGRCLGRGRNGGGNPASTNPEQAAAAIIASVEAAVSEAGGAPIDMAVAHIALAGPQAHVAQGRLETAFRSLGLKGPIVFSGDLLAMFASVTPELDGYCVVAGTGAGAVRIRNGAIERAVDANGWLVGDGGSGFWLGRQAAKAVVAELDERGEKTSLTPALLEALAVPRSDAWADTGRPAVLKLFIDAIYAMRPIELARFAPLVIAHRDDPVAAALIARAEGFLAADFRTAFDPAMPGPVALGGGVISHLTGLPAAIAEIVRDAGAVPDIRLVADGSVGAVVLALRAFGRTVDDQMFSTIVASLAARVS